MHHCDHAGINCTTKATCDRYGCANAPRTYVNDSGEEKPDRRRKDRANDDERIEHLFGGFDSCIESAKLSGDAYRAGYLAAMRQEFGQLIAALVR